MRLIDADALMDNLGIAVECKDCTRNGTFGCVEDSAFVYAFECITDAPTIVEFEGDINKVIVKGEEYHKQLTTTWLGNFCPYRCEHCWQYTDSKTPFCAWCGRRANNYD
jgi:hypothetical protein